MRGLQSIREIIAQLEEEDRQASEWWQDTKLRLTEKPVPKKAPTSAKPKMRKSANERARK